MKVFGSVIVTSYLGNSEIQLSDAIAVERTALEQVYGDVRYVSRWQPTERLCHNRCRHRVVRQQHGPRLVLVHAAHLHVDLGDDVNREGPELRENAGIVVAVRIYRTDRGHHVSRPNAGGRDGGELHQGRPDLTGVRHTPARAGSSLKREASPGPNVERDVQPVEVFRPRAVLARQRHDIVDPATDLLRPI